MTSDEAVAGFEPGAPAASPRLSPTAAGVIFAATAGLFVSVTPTIISVMGVFLKPIAVDFGWSRSAVAGALAVSALGNAVACPFAGKLADRIGPRRTALIGIAMLGLALLLISRVPPVRIIYYLAFAFAGAVGSMSSALVLSKILSEWFDETRGLWLGFTSGIGIGLGALLFPMGAAAMLAHHGWRLGFVADGAFVLAVAFPILFVLLRQAPVRRPKETAAAIPLEGLSYRQTMRSWLFWWIFSIVPVGGGCLTAMFSTIVPLLTDRGISVDGAVLVIQAFAFTTMFVEPAAGWIADRTTSPRVIAPLFLTAASGLWMLLHVHSEGTLLIAGVLIGVGAGVEYTLLPYLLSRYFGLREFGAIAGVAFAGTLVVGSLAPLLLNETFDLFGRYDAGVYVIIGILLYGGAAILTFRPYRYAAHHR